MAKKSGSKAWSLQEVPLASLRFDLQNPRLEKQTTQRDALEALIREQGEKVVNLAEDILGKGTDPSSLPIVTPEPDEPDTYVVLEGNRRLSALRVLDNPDRASNVLPAPTLKRLRELAKDFAEAPIAAVTCVVFEDREAADHWILLKHRGEQKGRGVVPWDTVEAARFEERRGQASRNAAAIAAVDLVRKSGKLDAETLARLGKVPITTVQRLLQDPDVRELLGIELRDGRLWSTLPESEVLKGLTRIIADAARGKLPVSRVDKKEDRRKYMEEFSARDLPSPKAARGEAREIAREPSEATAQAPGDASGKTAKSRSVPSTQSRPTTIPRSTVLAVKGHRKANDIYRELKQLDVRKTPIAAGVLLRVFLELTLDHYLETVVGKKVKEFREKITTVADYLEEQKIMGKKALTGLRLAADEERVLAVSLTTLHQYVHSKELAPSADNLRSAWNQLESFFMVIWK